MGVTGITGGRPALPQNILSASVSEGTGVLAARRGSQESIYVRSGPNPDSIIGEATFRPQSA